MNHSTDCPLCGSELAATGSEEHLEEPYPRIMPKHEARSLEDIGEEAARLQELGQLTPQAYRRLVLEAFISHSHHLENWVRLSLGWNRPFCPLEFPSFECSCYAMQELYWSLNDRIMKLGEDVQEVRGKLDKWYVEYRTTLVFIRIGARQNSLVVFLRVDERNQTDPQGWTTKVNNLDPFNIEFRLDSANQLDYAMTLIQQAYDYVP